MSTIIKPENHYFDPYANHEVRISLLENNFQHMSASLNRIEDKLNKLDEKIDFTYHKLDQKIDTVYHKLDEKIDSFYERLDKKIDNRFFWLLGAIVALIPTIVAITSHHS